MDQRLAVPGDKLKLVIIEGRRILVSITDGTEVSVAHSTVVEIDYISREQVFIFFYKEYRMIEDAIFFQPEKEKSIEIWVTSDRKRALLKNLPIVSTFVITKHRRVFKCSDDIFFGKSWSLTDDIPGWDKSDCFR